MKLGSVYKIIDLRTDKVIYVGQHRYKSNPNDSYMGSGSSLKVLYKAEGRKNFKKIVIAYDIHDQKDMDIIEKLFIKTYNTIDEGYNLHEGGAASPGKAHAFGYKLSNETNKKISDSKKCSVPWNKGLKLPNYSKRMKGYGNTFFGKKHTEESKKKISNAIKNKTSK